MPPKPKRRRVECLLCHRTYDSDYRRCHNENHHPERAKKHQHIPFKDAGAPVNPFQAARSSSSSIKAVNEDGKTCGKLQLGVSSASFESISDLPSDEISIDRAEPPEVEGALSTQNESQEARKLPDISITLSPPDNEENGNTGMGTLLEKKLADDTQGAEFHSEQQDYSNAMTDPGIFDLDNMDETLQKRLILNGANQPKSADMLQKAFPKSKHGSHFRSFNDSWYNSKVGKETVHRNWISYSPSKDAVFCHFCMFFGKGNKEKVFTRTGFSNWKDAQEKLGKHEKSQCHIDSTVDFINFCAQTCISQQLSNQARRIESERKKRVEKNRAVMKRLIEITVLFSKARFTFQGSS
eukprot:Seg287.14 transcript_id=Seg287.14/GoldUCD/mRNA.D3Y31 product="Zinc finger MYM-type protein 5" pseudo=true protein_id=Seg287.14/GoldUCD/D3Y31